MSGTNGRHKTVMDIIERDKGGARPGNRLAKSGRQWEDEVATAIASIPGLRLEHFGAPTRIIGVGQTKAGRRAPMVAFEGPAPLDFAGHYVGRHCEIDCKRMTEDRQSWPFLTAMSPDQVARANDLERSRCMVGIALLCDKAGKCYGIPWRFIMLRVEAGFSSITLADLDVGVQAGNVADLQPQGSLYLRPFITMLHDLAMEV